MPNLLLTGSTGFVGRNYLLRALASGRYQTLYLPVRSPLKLRSQFQGDGFEKIPENVVVIESSAHDWKLPADLCVDEVVHAAGLLFGRSPAEYQKTNVTGTINLIRSLPKTARIVVLSSQAAAGPCPEGALSRSETHLDAPLTQYGKSKLQMEQEVRAQFSDRSLVVLRPSMVLGARDQATLPLFKMAKLPVMFKPGFRPKFYSFISVRDLITAIEAAFLNPHWPKENVFFVASSVMIRDRDLLSTAGQVAGAPGHLLPVPQAALKLVSEMVERVPFLRNRIPTLTRDRAQEIWPDRWVINSSAFEKTFGWKAQQDLRSVLTETYDWYLKSGQL